MIAKKKLSNKWAVYFQQLGKGQFAYTYIAKPLPNQQATYACKVIDKRSILERIFGSQSSTGKKYLIERIQSEIAVLQEANHQNIVKLIDFCETQNNIYFILELCEGGDLEKFMIEQKLTPKDFDNFAWQLVQGCTYLHEKGILHRDLKPANILVHRGQLKINDFGLAKILNQQAQIMKSGTKVGTPLYMAPQVLKQTKYTIKCDVWSLGVILYQMHEGQLPFNLKTTDSQSKLISKLQNQQLRFMESTPDWIQELLRGMLSFDESTRWSITNVKAYFQKQLKA